jgi:hypothetical protein
LKKPFLQQLHQSIKGNPQLSHQTYRESGRNTKDRQRKQTKIVVLLNFKQNPVKFLLFNKLKLQISVPILPCTNGHLLMNTHMHKSNSWIAKQTTIVNYYRYGSNNRNSNSRLPGFSSLFGCFSRLRLAPYLGVWMEEIINFTLYSPNSLMCDCLPVSNPPSLPNHHPVRDSSITQGRCRGIPISAIWGWK